MQQMPAIKGGEANGNLVQEKDGRVALLNDKKASSVAGKTNRGVFHSDF